MLLSRRLLVEFKYTESVNEDAVRQTLAYDLLHRRSQGFKAADLQSFLLSSRTPQRSTRA